MFVALGASDRVAVVDAHSYEVKQYLSVGKRPERIELSSDGSKLYVANGVSNDLTIVDVATLKPERSLRVGRTPWGVAVTP